MLVLFFLLIILISKSCFLPECSYFQLNLQVSDYLICGSFYKLPNYLHIFYPKIVIEIFRRSRVNKLWPIGQIWFQPDYYTASFLRMVFIIYNFDDHKQNEEYHVTSKSKTFSIWPFDSWF